MSFSKIIAEDDVFRHEVVNNENIEYGMFFNQMPDLKIVDFDIDNFQKHSNRCLDRMENLVLAAHTGSGKTIAARYAIELGLKEGKRVVYTGPIKSLINQKYYEFKNAYPNKVGIITGDRVVDSDKDIIVMVTEVFEKMCHEHRRYMEKIAHVIYDEAHFMGDLQRGKIWEMSIINCPRNINLLLLSATIENSKQVAAWISKIKMKPCHLITTKRRFIPLEYHVYLSNDNTIYTVKDKDGKIYKKALEKVKNGVIAEGVSKKSLCNVLEKLTAANYIPALFYCSSRKFCDKFAMFAEHKFDLLNKDEKENMLTAINGTLEKYMNNQVLMREMMTYKDQFLRGIAVHHSGLLKITRDFIEKCLEYKHIKVIFTTETLAVGLNCPVSACVFTDFKKFDGVVQRVFNYGEFTQMAGRAGRRGIDEKGVVVLMSNKNLDVDALEKILESKSTPMNSQLAIDYGFILDMCSQNDYGKVLKNSFRNFQHNTLEADISLFEKRREILKELEFIGSDNQLTKKGAFAACISYNPGALVIASLIENSNLFNSDIQKSAAILSLFVCPQDLSNKTCMEAAGPISMITEIKENINRIEENNGISENERLNIECCSLFFKNIIELIGGRSLQKVVDDSEFYAGIILKIIKDVKQIAEKIASVTKEEKKLHFMELMDALTEFLKDDKIFEY